MDYRQMYEKWLTFDSSVRSELENLDDNEIKERFHKELEFGTGGLRGIMGYGTNRMNVYTVRKATQGFADYINKSGIKNPSIAIGYDSRNNSAEFAKEAALVMNANGIKSYIYRELKPTPMLSYAVRRLKATAGIVITASHNPKEYNGYKAYWSDGGQITEEHADGILGCISSIDYSQIRTMGMEEASVSGLYRIIGEEIENDYISNVVSQSVDSELLKEMGEKLNIVYTPIHGSGNKPVRKALESLGFSSVHVVKEQELPDGNFPTAVYPNPEDPKVFKLAMELADRINADIIIGTDPDCDRVGVVVKDSNGEYKVLSGNQTGVLLTDYILSGLKRENRMPENPTVIKTIVTTEMAVKICSKYGVRIIDVLTGFKYIGEKIKEFEENNSGSYIFGFEESYGYLAGTYARDKDAVVACSLICEMAAYHKKMGKTLYDALIDLYNEHGYFVEDLKSVTMTGIEGSKKIENIMTELREKTPKDIDGVKVKVVKDYLSQRSLNIETGEEEKIDLPVSNVIQLVLEDESVITARPSGTEPKIKFYFAVKGESSASAKEKIKAYKMVFEY